MATGDHYNEARTAWNSFEECYDLFFIVPVLFIALLLLPVLGFSGRAGSPRFEDYRVSKIYTGKVKPPQFGDPSEYSGTDVRCFGGDPAEYSKLRVNFAGHYVIGACSCGTGCHYLFMWDAATGRLYRDFPFGPIDVGPFDAGGMAPPFEYKGEQFRNDSSLLILDGCIEDTCDCATRYYEWKGRQFVLVLRHLGRMPSKCVHSR